MVALCSSVCSQMRSGLGKMNSDTLKAEQMTCHSTTVASISSQGAQASFCLLFMMGSVGYWVMAAPAPVLRMAPMWPRSSCTMSVNSGV
jgi:hypothetical protein